MTAAVFDLNHHAIVAGWATYHEDRQAHPHIDAPPPEPPNGYSPSNYAKCACGWAVKWFVVGQHRYGSLSRSNDARSRIEAAPCSQCAAWHDIGHRFLATSGSRAALESTT